MRRPCDSQHPSDRTPRTRRARLATVIVLAGLLASCGGDDSSAGSPAPTDSAAVESAATTAPSVALSAAACDAAQQVADANARVDGASQAFAADPSDATWAEVRRAATEEHDGLTRAYADLGAAAPELAGDVQTAGDATLQLLELYEGFPGPFTTEGLQAAVQQAFSAQYLIEVQASGRRVQDSVRSSCEIDLAGS